MSNRLKVKARVILLFTPCSRVFWLSWCNFGEYILYLNNFAFASIPTLRALGGGSFQIHINGPASCYTALASVNALPCPIALY